MALIRDAVWTEMRVWSAGAQRDTRMVNRISPDQVQFLATPNE
jgi:hypothetical protein